MVQDIYQAEFFSPVLGISCVIVSYAVFSQYWAQKLDPGFLIFLQEALREFSVAVNGLKTSWLVDIDTVYIMRC